MWGCLWWSPWKTEGQYSRDEAEGEAAVQAGRADGECGAGSVKWTSPICLFPKAYPGSWAQNSKWSVVGDTSLVENLFPFFAALGHQWVTPVCLSSKRWRQERQGILCRSVLAAAWSIKLECGVSHCCMSRPRNSFVRPCLQNEHRKTQPRGVRPGPDLPCVHTWPYLMLVKTPSRQFLSPFLKGKNSAISVFFWPGKKPPPR